jgi:hypothetical protein
MAHIDLDHGAAYARRPAATSPIYPARPAPVEETGRPRAPRPAFCRLNVGQVGRSLLLVMVCVGFWQLPRAEKSPPRAAVATPALKPF